MSLRTQNSTNPIALRSRDRIITALFDLMEQANYNDITIKEIVFKAQLGRRTFYSHFATKDDILPAYLADLAAKYLQDAAKHGAYDINYLAQRFFEMAIENRRAFELMRQSNLSIPVDMIEQYQVELSRVFPKRFVSSQTDMPVQKFVISYRSGALLNVFNRWIDSGMIESPQEMARLFEYFEPRL